MYVLILFEGIIFVDTFFLIWHRQFLTHIFPKHISFYQTIAVGTNAHMEGFYSAAFAILAREMRVLTVNILTPFLTCSDL